MDEEWSADDDETVELPLLIGFSIELLPEMTLAVELRGVTDVAPQDRHLHIGMSAHGARELAVALLKAADMTGDLPVLGTRN
jgi:hypothetical protein